MSARYPGLPICRHIAIGAGLQDIRNALFDMLEEIDHAYPKSSPAARQAHATLRQLDQLRSTLDNVSADENPVEEWAPQVYYGEDRERRGPIIAAILERHEATEPDCGYAEHH